MASHFSSLFSSRHFPDFWFHRYWFERAFGLHWTFVFGLVFFLEYPFLTVMAALIAIHGL